MAASNWPFDNVIVRWDYMSRAPGAKWALNPDGRRLAPGKMIGGNIRILREIATANNSVYEAFDPSLQLPNDHRKSNCAIKARIKVHPDGSAVTNLGKEVDIHYRVNEHPNIATLFKVFEYSSCSLMVLEHFPDGDLQTVIRKKLGDEGFLKDAFLQILDAVEFCHSRGVYHRDLKVANILVNGSRMAVADFGHATLKSTSYRGVGTISCMSPECYISFHQAENSPVPYDTGPSDIWSLGIILTDLITGRIAWQQPSMEDDLYRSYRENGRFRHDSKFTSAAKHILANVLVEDPMQRLSITELRHFINLCPQFVIMPPPTPDFSGIGAGGGEGQTESVSETLLTNPFCKA